MGHRRQTLATRFITPPGTFTEHLWDPHPPGGGWVGAFLKVGMESGFGPLDPPSPRGMGCVMVNPNWPEAGQG